MMIGTNTLVLSACKSINMCTIGIRTVLESYAITLASSHDFLF